MWISRSLILLCLGVLAACSPPQTVQRESNLRADLDAVARAETIVILVPGALASTSLFGSAFDWADQRTALVEYRFPGFDGLPLDRDVHILSGARSIAGFANRFPDARIRLMGFSTGGAIAIEAAARMTHADVEVAAISSAVPFPGMLGAGPRGLAGLARAAAVARPLRAKEIWIEYFKILLFGRDWESNPATRKRANAYTAEFGDRIEPPSDGIGRSHTSNLLVWSLSKTARDNQPKVRFYHGANDTVVPLRLVQRLADDLNAEVVAFEPDAHLILITRPSIVSRAGRDLGIRGALK